MSEEEISPGFGGRRARGVRASDEDREQLIAELNEHSVAGRLDTDELERRVSAAYEATTTGELDALRSDLPAPSKQVALQHAERRRQLTRRMVQESGGSLSAFVVCTVIWAASGAHGQFWPVWVLLVFLLSVVRNGWALYGPAPDLDAVEAQLDARRAQRLSRDARRGDRRRR
ncbi:MAG TPA: DUF1707 domain-containing protein [Solirubrobacteraceae bacterium]|nr:DUF1707 domain-containing protein [Solirubrobacteraceae bacterium]